MLIACAACARPEPDMTVATTFTDPAAAQVAEAVRTGNAALLRELVAGGANPNADGAHGTTLLQWAMLHGHRPGAIALLDAGADPARGNAAGVTAMHLAAMADTASWLDLLLQRSVDPDTPNTVTRATPLMAALMAERGGNVDRLLAAGARIEATDRQDNTALHLAAKINQADRVLSLLEAGADPARKNAQGVTFQRYLWMTGEGVLDAATRRQRDAVGAWLRAHGVPVEAPSAR